MNKSLSVQLSKIEKLAEEKQEKLDALNYKKYFPLFEIAIKYLQKQPVLLYGGFAINELMPANLKIYKKNALPDIDVMCVHPHKIGNGLIDIYKRLGYDTASFSGALHDGTYKVYVHGLQVLDITQISSYAYGKLSKNSLRGSTKIRIIDPEFLRLSLHTMMSQSNDAHRWTKVFERLIKFYKAFPPRLCKSPAKSLANIDKVPSDLISLLYKFLEKKPYILFGTREIEHIIGKKTPFTDPLPIIQCIVDTEMVETVAQQMHAHVSRQYHTEISQVFMGDDFAPPHCFLYFKRVPLVAIYSADACMTYNEFGNHRVASVHTLLRMILSMRLSSYQHLHKNAENYTCIGAILSILQQKIGNSKKRLHQQFILDCYGTQMGLITQRRHMILRKKNLSANSSDGEREQ